MLFGRWDVLTCVSTSKVPTPEKVPTRADTSTCRHVPTPLGADTCRHLWYQSYELYLDTGMCWQMPAPGKVPIPRKVPTRAGMCQHIKVPAQVSTHLRADTYWHMNVIWKVGCADMCQHLEGADTWEGADTCRHLYVPTPLGADTCRHRWYQSYELYLDTGMCWQMPAPGKVPTPRKVPTRAGMCQHIKVPAQVSTHLRADTCWHMNVIWKVGCADMCQHLEGADTWEGADTSTCRHVPTPIRCRHVPTPVISVIWTLLGYWDVLANASTWKGADT